MGSILKESDRAEIVSRLGSLSALSTRKWGTLDVIGMLQHLNLSARMTLGELPVASSNKRVFQTFPFKHLILYVLPFPKGAPTAPELIARSGSAVLEDERLAFARLFDQLSGITAGSLLQPHPAFGVLSYDEYGALMAKHTAHHFRQFGI